MRMVCFTVGLTLLAGAGACQAQATEKAGWRIIEWAPDIVVAIDESSLQRTADGVRVTGATVFGEAIPVRGRSMTHLKSTLDFSCPVERVRESYSWHFDRSGQFEEGDTGVGWGPASPGSLYEAIATAACADDLSSLGAETAKDFDAVVAIGLRKFQP